MSFFNDQKKGEIQDLIDGINSTNVSKKKLAMQRIISMMMSGENVASLLPHVLVNMQTRDLELKKLIYLYLVNYSKSEPELALHAVNTFDKDSRDENPLVRALAIRTMACIRIDQITEYVCEPLQRCLKDPDPYVKKTAVLGVAKVYDINPSLVEDEGLLDTIHELLGDGNPMVVSNCVATLSEIQMQHPEKNVFVIDKDVRSKLVFALKQSSEWGKILILDAFALFYTPENNADAEDLAERVSVHLIHDNSAVVLSAVKIILKMLPLIENKDLIQQLFRKMAPPLVSLISSTPEVRYVALRNLNLIVQRLPSLLTSQIKTFFCKYNDPLYVKMEKLEIIMLLVNEQNVALVMNELKEYASEVDVEFVRKSIRAMGRCAILIPQSANLCVESLMHLVRNSQVNYIVQEAVVVIRDIFRKYPNRYESVITTLCDKLSDLDEPEAREAMVWIIGEYADRIEGADQILETYFVDSFPEETSAVQLAILTAVVKTYLVLPSSSEILKSILKQATKKTDNPELRDRAYIYWRMLASDKTIATQIVRGHRPPIVIQKHLLPKNILNELIPYLGTLASVFHKLPKTFSVYSKALVPTASKGASSSSSSGESPESGMTPSPNNAEIPGIEMEIAEEQRKAAAAASAEFNRKAAERPSQNSSSSSQVISNLDVDDELIDLGDFGISSSSSSSSYPSGANATAKTEQINYSTVVTPLPASSLPVLVPNQNGINIKGDFIIQNGKPGLAMIVYNGGSVPLTSAELQFNLNSFGLQPLSCDLSPYPINPNETRNTVVPIGFSEQLLSNKGHPPPSVSSAIQLGIQLGGTSLILFSSQIKFYILLKMGGINDTQSSIAVKELYNPELATASQEYVTENVKTHTRCIEVLKQHGMIVTNQMSQPNLQVYQIYGATQGVNADFVAELAFTLGGPGANSLRTVVRARPAGFSQMVAEQIGVLCTL